MSDETTLRIVEIRNSVKSIVGNSEVVNALAQTTFQGLEPSNIPKALLEGMIRGYSLNDFLTKKIYALPFKDHSNNTQNYSLVTSIADTRSIAVKAGQSGKSAPHYEFSEDGKLPISCSVTVWKKGGDDRGYTATVYFSEYTTGKNLWVKKPLTMIAKVAEVHALRMAFPDELAQHYIEEEFEQDANARSLKDRFIEVDPNEMTIGKNENTDKKTEEENPTVEGAAESNEEAKK